MVSEFQPRRPQHHPRGLAIMLAACATGSGQASTSSRTTSDGRLGRFFPLDPLAPRKAAQMVWPVVSRDYTAVDNAAWTRVRAA
jgi:hypothetical protein